MCQAARLSAHPEPGNRGDAGRARIERSHQSQVGDLDPWPCFQSLCVRLPCVACAAQRALADRRRLNGEGGPWAITGRRAPGAAAACPSRSCSRRFRITAARFAKRGKKGGEEGSAGSVRHDKSRWQWPGRHARGCRGGRGLGVRRRGRVVADTVTVRDSERFAEPLALPRSCPPYVRDQWITRTHDRILWWPASLARTCSRCRFRGMFSQLSMHKRTQQWLAENSRAASENPARAHLPCQSERFADRSLWLAVLTETRFLITAPTC